MKNTFIKKIGAALAILMLTMFSQVWIFGQEVEEKQSMNLSSSRQRTIEGAWRNQITPVDCQTGVPSLPFTIQGLLTYHRGGTMSETHSAPGARSPGHGVWSRRNGNSYKGSFVLLQLNPDGTFNGRVEITQNIHLDSSGDIFNDNATFKIFDANDNLIASGCATVRATRFE